MGEEMPIYKIIKLPSGKKIRRKKGAPNKGGQVIGWKIEKVKGKPHKTHKKAVKQLQAIKASQRRRRK